MPAKIDRIMALAFFRVLLLVVLALSACGKGCSSGDKADAGGDLPQACKRSFAPVLDAYEVVFEERVPEECRMLDKAFRVSVVQDKDELATLCGNADIATNEKIRGCWIKQPPLVLIYEQGDNVAMTDTAVHEWIHVLHFCVTSYTHEGSQPSDDSMHMNGKLWDDFKRDHDDTIPVEARAGAAIVPGPCL